VNRVTHGPPARKERLTAFGGVDSLNVVLEVELVPLCEHSGLEPRSSELRAIDRQRTANNPRMHSTTTSNTAGSMYWSLPPHAGKHGTVSEAWHSPLWQIRPRHLAVSVPPHGAVPNPTWSLGRYCTTELSTESKHANGGEEGFTRLSLPSPFLAETVAERRLPRALQRGLT